MTVTVELWGSKITLEFDPSFEEGRVVPLRELLKKLEREVIQVMMAQRKNKKKVAQKLNMKRTTLIETCRRYGLEIEVRPLTTRDQTGCK